MEKVLEFLKKAGTWYLATVDDSGEPHVRPFGAQNIFEGKLYIQTGLKKNVAKQMLAHPKVAISGMADGSV
ncbi:pyridoxamine 5'-phosphate oxidase family protein [[Clostridium] aminophilum]|uniref:pyridoxamine 5'-phosphate oxidase family protein n=1 Tax=[Clostridium] aminophilum TaxID=1526 RepID=UPI002ED582CD